MGRRLNGTSNGVDRRKFLMTGATSALALGSGLWVGNREVEAAAVRKFRGRARNIIFLVSDGMSAGTLTMADHLMRKKYGRASAWMTLYEENRARRALMDMASLDSIVTDSAAAAASWGCGRRVNNNSVNIGPDGEEYVPILPIFRDAGKATGLVTTTTVTHATPAGFAANVPNRGQEAEIAVQYAERRFDVILGGGERFFSDRHREDGLDVFRQFADAGYTIVRDRNTLLGAEAVNEPLIGIFTEGHHPYSIDRESSEELTAQVPTLAEMTDAALRRLAQHPNGFIIQIEGGRVDHGAHGNDVAAMLYDQIAFDDAIATALAFAENREDTLVIITTDHGNANPGLSGMGWGYTESDGMFDRLIDFRQSNNWILSGLSETSSVEEITGRVLTATGIEIADHQAETLRSAFAQEYRALNEVMSSPSAAMGQILANYVAVNFISGAHTSDFVELAVLGPGSEAVDGFVRNTDLFDLMLVSAGVEVAAGG